MTLNQFRPALAKPPFRSIRILLADGRSLQIEHPGFAAMDPRGRELRCDEEDGSQHFNDALLIAKVVVPAAPEPTQAHG
jgi:hypothetical protein